MKICLLKISREYFGCFVVIRVYHDINDTVSNYDST